MRQLRRVLSNEHTSRFHHQVAGYQHGTHIPERTAKLLNWQDPDIDDCPVSVPDGKDAPEPLWGLVSYTSWSDYGWIFFVSEEQSAAAHGAGHPELAALIAFALEQGCGYLKLDCDADTLPYRFGLLEFEW